VGDAAPPVPENVAVIRNAAGFREADAAGGGTVSLSGTVGEINLTRLYGHLPVGMGFDIAAAAIGRRAGRIPGGNGSESGEGSEIVGTPGTTPPVVCVRNGAAGGWGRVVVEGQ
jgi:hypothetical protein